jgi:hypothetical protein
MVGRTTPRGRSCWPRTSLNCYWLQPMLTGTPGTSHVGAWTARTEPAPVPRAPASACGPAHPRGRRTRRARRRPADGAPRGAGHRRPSCGPYTQPANGLPGLQGGGHDSPSPAGQRRRARRNATVIPRPSGNVPDGMPPSPVPAFPLPVPRPGHGCGAATETTRASVLDSPALAGDRSASSLESVREPGWAQCC